MSRATTLAKTVIIIFYGVHDHSDRKLQRNFVVMRSEHTLTLLLQGGIRLLNYHS